MAHEETVYEALTAAHGDEGHWVFGTGFDDPLAGVDTTVPEGIDPAEVRGEGRDVLTTVLERATLRVPAWPADVPPRGRAGEHGPELTALLDTLQGLARQHPAATW